MEKIYGFFLGSMSIVGVEFPEFRSIAVFESVFMFV